jgi:hypothetical protein
MIVHEWVNICRHSFTCAASPPRRVAVPVVWQSQWCGGPSRAERAFRVITEYFWVHASGIFRDHESDPAAWGAEGSGHSG